MVLIRYCQEHSLLQKLNGIIKYLKTLNLIKKVLSSLEFLNIFI